MSVTNVGVDFRATPLSEALTPELSYQQSVKTSSLIKDRINNIIYPRTGQQTFEITATNQPTIEFQISNTAFTDNTTPCLIMDVSLVFDTTGANPDYDPTALGSRVVATESLCPWFYQVQELINSSLIETVTDVDLANFFKAMWQQPRDTYRTKSRFANRNFRWSESNRYASPGSQPAGTGDGVCGQLTNIPPDTFETQQWAGVTPQAGVVYTGPVQQLVVPLNWMALFSGGSYLPPYATSNILLKLYTNQISRIFTSANYVANVLQPGPIITQINLANIRLSYDAVVVAPAVEDAMMGMLNAGGKIFYPMVHHRVQNDVANIGNTSASGPKQFLLNCPTSNLISLYQFFLKPTQLQSSLDPLSYMINPGFGSLSQSSNNRYYIQVGSKTFPSVSQIVGASSMWLELLKALGDGPLLTDDSYYYPISPIDTATAGQATYGRTGLFALGVNFERLIGAVSQSANAGISTRGVSGLVQAYLSPASVAPASGTFVASLQNDQRLISVMSYLEYLIIERGGVVTTNV